jgi:hypothetical protein
MKAPVWGPGTRGWTVGAFFFVRFLGSFLLLLANGCSKHAIFENKEDFEIRIVSDLPQEVSIPSSLWDRVEGKVGILPGTLPAAAAPTSSEGSSGEIIFAPLRVYLIEKNDGILHHPKYKIDYPLGGGKLDLEEFTTGQTGSFYFGLEIPEIPGLTDLRVYYVSQARARKIDGEIFGAGCNVYMNISAQFQKEMLKEGLKVNTARNRHVSVLAGLFILTAQKGKQIVVTQLKVTDSKNSQLLCSHFSSSNSKESSDESDK